MGKKSFVYSERETEIMQKTKLDIADIFIERQFTSLMMVGILYQMLGVLCDHLGIEELAINGKEEKENE